MFTQRIAIATATLMLLATSACTHYDTAPPSPPPPPPPQVGTLSRTLNMTDNEGRLYGTVELDPVGGGHVRDSNGRLIGDIVTPEK